MGGRGTYSIGRHVKYQYETIGKVGGIKILKGIQGTNKHDLPMESHSSNAYIKVDKHGNVKQIRLYNEDHTAKTDIDFSKHRGKTYLHAHNFNDGSRQAVRALNENETKLYRRIMEAHNDKK